MTLLDRPLSGDGEALRSQLRRRIVAAVGAGRLAPGQRLPPSRLLARQLGVARNTVAAVYDELRESCIVITAPRHGVFVAPLPSPAAPALPSDDGGAGDTPPVLRRRPSTQRNIVKPADWRDCPYPFVYG